MSIEGWLLAFVSMFLLDVVWVLYTKAAVANRFWSGAVYAALIHGFGAVAAISYIGDHRYLTATMAGTVLGTFCVLRWSSHKETS